MADTPDSVEQDVDLLEAGLRRLEAEYNMYFAGRLPRPPLETRAQVTAIVRRIDNTHITNYGLRFRFTTLQTRFAKFVNLWDRGLRAKEEGRSGPFVQSRQETERPKDQAKERSKQPDRVVSTATFSDPVRELERVQNLYEKLAEARQAAGQEAIPFPKFAEMVKSQVGALKAKGSNEVAFRIAVKDGKVALTARGVSGSGTRPKE
ncbi:MAG: hypothetical protein HOP16_01700 [Acidobacteria bacterium]|nr:hypothetical protein [Acidobacteriota bacterium]